MIREADKQLDYTKSDHPERDLYFLGRHGKHITEADKTVRRLLTRPFAKTILFIVGASVGGLLLWAFFGCPLHPEWPW